MKKVVDVEVTYDAFFTEGHCYIRTDSGIIYTHLFRKCPDCDPPCCGVKVNLKTGKTREVPDASS